MSNASTAMVCKEEDGTMRQHGDKWNKDDCTICKCRVSMVIHIYMALKAECKRGMDMKLYNGISLSHILYCMYSVENVI